MSDTNPLNYRPRERPPSFCLVRGDGTAGRFFIGLALGTLASLVYWPSVWHALDISTGRHAATILYGFIGIKLIAVIVLLCVPRRRAIGAGLLVSFVTGFMVFFGVCAANFTI